MNTIFLDDEDDLNVLESSSLETRKELQGLEAGGVPSHDWPAGNGELGVPSHLQGVTTCLLVAKFPRLGSPEDLIPAFLRSGLVECSCMNH